MSSCLTSVSDGISILLSLLVSLAHDVCPKYFYRHVIDGLKAVLHYLIQGKTITPFLFYPK